MPVSNHYKRVPCKDIIIKRDARQRQKIDVSDLMESISKRGVLQPILLHRDLTLIAGERRLTASIALGLPDIPCRFMDELTPIEAQIIELEENLRRADLTWQETTKAIGGLHTLFLSSDPAWTASATARELGYDSSTVIKHLRVFKEMKDPKVLEMPSFAAAYNFFSKKDERSTHSAVAMIIETGQALRGKTPDPNLALMQAVFGKKGQDAPAEKLAEGLKALAEMPPQAPKVVLPQAVNPPSESILHQDFLSWVPLYQGKKFNFIHCDFPYGIDVFAGKQSSQERTLTSYDDSEGTYWQLLQVFLEYRDYICQNTCHIMFWFSMDYYTQTIEYFRKHAPEFTINPFPLVWHKSDGSAILPDPRRGARRSYETALLAYRGDRPIVKAVSNLYSAPTDKKFHPSTKPEPMLRHFFQLFVDQHTYMLDPTCGGGSALRAAESMGADYILGLEKDKTFFDNACIALKEFRWKAQAGKAAGQV